MLSTLRVENLVLIERLELTFGPGLNVLTGETGAGKSILVDALGLVLGARAKADLVRAGAAEAAVEALFTIEDPALGARLVEAGLPADELVVRRVVTREGRSRGYLNGRLATAAELARAAEWLVDIASQHESVALTDPATHLEYLDAFAGLLAERGEVAGAVDAHRAARAALREAEARASSRAEREAFARFQLAGIEELAPVAGEEAELAAERARLRNADRIASAIDRAVAALDDGEAALTDALARVVADLRSAAAFDASLTSLADTVDAARAELAEVARDLARRARDGADPERLSAIEERLFALERLKRQHRGTLDDVLAAAARLRAELAALEGSDELAARLSATAEEALLAAGRLAVELSARRKRAADELGASITKELAALGMGAAKVVVDVAPLAPDADDPGVGGARLSREGVDRVEFLIAPNKGAEPRPLRRVASGGELSRALLALKRALSSVAPRGTYVFDEVDTGVGGAVAAQIGLALADIAASRQVICITHLAQIAAFGATHFVVEKSAEGGATTSRITELSEKQRVHELARMQSGATVGAQARRAAEELLAGARRASTRPRRSSSP
ncbi:MAG: DNA repair protein RecN [Polyangiaceae bacterium]|nr:DNA repair protein RecN [Polyangiaceae bacterium]